MRRTLLALVFVSTYFTIALAQPQDRVWVRYFDVANLNDALYDVYATSDGGFAACGRACEEVLYHGLWLVKTDQNGLLDWERRYFRGVNNEVNHGFTLIQLDDDGYALGGQFAQAGGGNTLKFGVLRTDSEGEPIWMNTYGTEDIYGDLCFGLIETKGGNILAVGRQSWNQGLTGYAVMIGGDGEVIWQKYYENTPEILAIREVVDEGYMLAGHWGITKIDQNGEIIWQRRYNQCHFKDMVSCAGDGFALVYTTGYRDRSLIDTTIVLTRVNNDGEILWESRYNFDRDVKYPSFQFYTKLARYNDGGFVICAQLIEAANVRRNYSYLLRVDRAGNAMWDRTDRNCGDPGSNEAYHSVVIHRDGALAVVGTAHIDDHNNDGTLVRFVPEHSPPFIISYSPTQLDTTILQRRSITFHVSATDWQNDELTYQWKINGEVAGDDSTLLHDFDDLGDFVVQCMVSDHEGADSISWNVSVSDFFIVDYTPDSLNLSLRRGASIDFSISRVRYTGGELPAYLWTRTNLSNGHQEEVGDLSRVTLDFPWSGDYTVEGKAYRGESSDQVTWNVAVRGVIWAYVPEDLAFDVEPESVVHFEVVPSEPENESLRIQWLVDGEIAAEDTTAFEWSFGQVENLSYQVSVVVADSVEADTVTWSVTVRDLAVPHDGSTADPPRSAGILSVSPNPFNSMLTIRYLQSPHAIAGGVGGVSLRIYDLSGREVFSTVSPPRLTAKQESSVTHGGATVERSVTWNASSVPAGVYLVRLQSDSDISTQKVVLLR